MSDQWQIFNQVDILQHLTLIQAGLLNDLVYVGVDMYLSGHMQKTYLILSIYLYPCTDDSICFLIGTAVTDSDYALL